MESCPARRLAAAQYLSVQNGKPGVGQPSPIEPALSYSGQFRGVGEPACLGLPTEIGLAQPLGPGLGPPGEIC